jgi:hypothetical protein
MPHVAIQLAMALSSKAVILQRPVWILLLVRIKETVATVISIAMVRAVNHVLRALTAVQ